MIHCRSLLAAATTFSLAPIMPYGWISSSLSNDGLIENLKVNVGLSDKVVSAMKRVDRANYCQVGEDAYYDSPQPMGHGQTISAPHVHALALEALLPFIKSGSSVMDVGSGSGYLAACFAELLKELGTGNVVGIDNSASLVEFSKANIKRDGKDNLLGAATSPPSGVCLTLIQGDGYEGYREKAPYDAIHVGAAMESIPKPLLEQLSPGGCFVGPVGPWGHQEFVKVTKQLDGTMTTRTLSHVRYVPLTPGLKV